MTKLSQPTGVKKEIEKLLPGCMVEVTVPDDSTDHPYEYDVGVEELGNGYRCCLFSLTSYYRNDHVNRATIRYDIACRLLSFGVGARTLGKVVKLLWEARK